MRMTAQLDNRLRATVVEVRPLLMPGGADPFEDRPAHVRAASGLTCIQHGLDARLAVIQDDASFVVLLDAALAPERAIPLPRGAGGHRLFGDDRGNKHPKPDYESCITIPDATGHTLFLFGSGSTAARETIVRIQRPTSHEPVVKVYDASPLYAALRSNTAFAGSELNVEGAVCDGQQVRLFNRGNGAARDGLEPLNATVDIDVGAFLSWLGGGTARETAPRLGGVQGWDLGEVAGCALGFTDATQHGGAILYSAVAELSPDVTRDGPVLGAAIGEIADGAARWTRIEHEDGRAFEGKVEGISVLGDRLIMVIDHDDSARPSELAVVRLSGPWRHSR